MLTKSLFAGVLLTGVTLMLSAAAGDPRLADAAQQGDLETVLSLLQQKTAGVNEPQGDGMTALHWAVYREDVAMSQALIQAGADVSATNRLKALTPLFIAATNGNAALIELLVKAGANVNSANALGTTPLMMAAASGSADAVTSLLNHGANVNARESAREQTALMFAAALNRDAVIRVLAEHGASLNASSKIVPVTSDLVDEDGNSVPAASRTGTTAKRPRGEGQVSGMGGLTALHYAAREGLIQAVKALVEVGSNVNQVNPLDNSSALVVAISNGHFDVAKYLLDHGADPNLVTVDGLGALYAAVESQWAPVAWTPTAFTSASGIVQQKTSYLDLMNALLDRGANPNARIKRTLWFSPPHHNDNWIKSTGATAFWRAAQATDVPAMKLLMAHGADPRIPSEDKTTVLAAAAGVGWAGNYSTNAPDSFLASVQYLVEDIGIDVNVADAAGYTAVMGAAYRGDNELVRYLIGKGAKLETKTERGWSVTDMANGPYLRSSFPVAHPDTVGLLVSLGAPAPIKAEDEEILGVIKRKFLASGEAEPIKEEPKKGAAAGQKK